MLAAKVERDTPSPLVVPELLEAIFSFIPPPLLRLAPYRVSRLWHSVAIRFIAYRGLWVDNLSEDELLCLTQRLPRLDMLKIQTSRNRNCQQWLSFLNKIQSWTRHVPLNSTETGEALPASLGRLRSLCLSGVVALDAILLPVLSSLPLLTHLRIEDFIDTRYPHILYISEILPAAPLLESLTIDCMGIFSATSLAVLWHRETFFKDLFTEDNHTRESAADTMPSMRGSCATAQPHYRMRHLTLCKVWIAQDHTELMLKHCPGLQSLKIVQCRQNLPYGTADVHTDLHIQGTFNRPFVQEEFYAAVISNCLGLKTVQVSFCDELARQAQLDVRAHLDFLQKFPSLDTVSFSTFRHSREPGFPSRLLDGCLERGLLLTTLEITSTCLMQVPAVVNQALHRYLCQAPQLQHLLASRVWFWTPMMSYEMVASQWNRWFTPSRHDDTSVWACKNLKTCHISLDLPSKEALLDTTRLALGYLSILCPKLKDMRLRLRQPWPLQLDGGLPLLMRLEELEVLELLSTGLTPQSKDRMVETLVDESELFWLQPEPPISSLPSLSSSSSPLSSMTVVLNRLERERLIKRKQTEARNALELQRTRTCPTTIPRDKLTLQDLEDLPLLISVVQVLENQHRLLLPKVVSMSGIGEKNQTKCPLMNPCWPRMHTLRLSSGATNLKLIPWLQQIRPEIDFRAVPPVPETRSFICALVEPVELL